MKRITTIASVSIALAAIAPTALAVEPAAEPEAILVARGTDVSTLARTLAPSSQNLLQGEAAAAERLEILETNRTLVRLDPSDSITGGCQHGAGPESVVDSKFHNFFQCKL